MPILHRDFETQSAAPLKKVGARRYAADPTTRVLCICFAVDDGPIESFVPEPGKPVPGVFIEAADNPEWLIAAHNDAFESAIEEYVLGPQFGWPLVPIERHRCTLAIARYRGLPGELGKVAELLQLPVRKDREGARLMLELCRPRKPHKDENKAQIYWPEITPEKLARLIEYCKNDVAVEREISRRLPRLPENEQRLWCVDRKINARGFAVDLALAARASELVQSEKARINARMRAATAGAIEGFTKLNDMREFVNARGHNMSKANKRAVTAVLAHDPDDTVREVLELRQASGNTAVEKYNAVLAGAFPDQRIRGLLAYYGAHTGRWTSAGFNAHNLPREDSADALAAIAAIQSGDLERVRAFGPPLEVIAGVARGLVVAPPSRLLLTGDFATIEPRVAAWFADERWKLDSFCAFDASGDPLLDPYRVLGARMRSREVDPDDAATRQHGKTVTMAFNYGASVRVWREHVPDDPRSDDEIKAQEVDKFRRLHPAQTRFMYNLDGQALRCVRSGEPVTCARHSFEMDGDTLILRLPSGRPLFYPCARIVCGKFGRDVVAYRAANKNGQVEMWYGAWLANLVSATARDLLVNALLELDAAGFAIVLHVHDEIVAEVDPAGVERDRERFKACMLRAPAWAEGLPLAAEVRFGERYIKTGATIPAELRETPIPAAELPETTETTKTPIPGETTELRETADAPVAVAAIAAAGLAAAPAAQPEGRSSGFDWTAWIAEGPASGNGHGYPWGERDIGHAAAEFIYRDLKGAPYLKVVKHKTKQGRKSFPQYHWDNGGWESGKPKGPAIPYHLPELLAAPEGARAWVCEGEKDADTLAALGLIATTNPGGAGKWTPNLNKWLAGFAGAYVLEDNDAAGRKHALQVATALSGVVPDIRVLAFRELPEHGDVTDWTEAGGTLEQLLERAQHAPEFAALECTCAADEDVEAIEWVWPGRFARGKIGLLVGLPDEGKGLALSDIMARITRGAPWPCGEGHAPLGRAVLLTAEDDVNDTIVPRLLAAGADLGRVTIVKMMHEAGTPRMFSLISDLSALRQKVIAIGEVEMIVIDPITAYLGIGKIDSFRATDVRAVLGPLKEFTAELRLCILAVMHFNKKIDITNVLLRISDSLAYGAAARHVYGVIDDRDNHRKLFVKGKNNLAPRDQNTLAFSFADRAVGTDKKTGAAIRAPYIVWQLEPVDITATEALQAAAQFKSPSARDGAKHFLAALLGDEPVDAKDVYEAAKENGISQRTLHRAKDDLGVEVKRDGPGAEGHRAWRWHLPTSRAADDGRE
jgi:DNA polymerase bacteriophage-type